jgi:hypothetical protein
MCSGKPDEEDEPKKKDETPAPAESESAPADDAPAEDKGFDADAILKALEQLNQKQAKHADLLYRTTGIKV